MTSGEIIAICIAIVAATPGILAFIAQWRRDKAAQEIDSRRAGADMVESVSNATRMLLEPLGRRVNELEEEIAEQRKETAGLTMRVKRLTLVNHRLCAGVRILIAQLEAIGYEPSYTSIDQDCYEFTEKLDLVT